MSIFYGVYLQESRLQTAFNVIRLLSEPDGLRFTHITLRGPYEAPLKSHQIESLNRAIESWSVHLEGPGEFFQGAQNTVIIRISLMQLSPLFRKKHYADGVPHITLYDGRDRAFATRLLHLLYRYDMRRDICVSKLRKVDGKAPLGGDFLSLYRDMHAYFLKFAGEGANLSKIRSAPETERLNIIERILDANFTRYYDNLQQVEIDDAQHAFSFG